MRDSLCVGIYRPWLGGMECISYLSRVDSVNLICAEACVEWLVIYTDSTSTKILGQDSGVV